MTQQTNPFTRKALRLRMPKATSRRPKPYGVHVRNPHVHVPIQN